MSRLADVLVIGSGAIGGSVALALAERGVSVTVVEAGRVGRGATWAAAGFLGPELNPDDPPALVELSTASLALWPEWVQKVEDQSGVGLNFRRDGLLYLWVDPEARNLPVELATAEPPTGSGERLTAAEVRRLEPALSGPILGAVRHAEDAQVDNPRLGRALARAAIGRGVRYRTGTPVVGFTREGQRCTGVRIEDGSTMAAGAVVVAAGAWSGPLATSSGIRLPVEPWRGQMLAFDALERPLGHMVVCGELVLIPRAHGPLVVGTTLEKVGFDTRVTLGGLAQILARADRIVSGLAHLPLAHTWAGLRPGSPDGLPYLGPVLGWDRLYAATGHGRKGILHAPLTGELMAGLIIDEEVDPRLRPCLPERAGS
ncbi:MAG TPA: glycine oxidase ThiO [Isosphaeraceae bacterium]|jgi:glycine oxidase|nr:glycine oxidase ThiO [Isosphaeraceae bacterium]